MMKERGLKMKVLMIGPVPKKYAGISVISGMLIDFFEKKGIEYKYISTYRKGNIKDKLFIFGSSIFKLILLLFRRRFDIYHIHISAYGSFYRKLMVFLILKLFLIKNIIFHLNASDFELFLKKGKLSEFFAKLIFKNSRGVLVVTPKWKEVIEKSLKINGKVFVLENPIITSTFNRKISKSKKVKILYMGLVGERKGIYVLIKGASFIKKDLREKIFFSICGNGEIEKARKEAEKHGVSDIFKFNGWISGDKKIEEFLSSHIYVLPSFREGFPVSILEAMASKLPIVTTPIYGMDYYLKDGVNSFFVKPGDAKGLAEKLSILIEDNELQRQMGEKNFELVKSTFDIEVVGNKLLSIYRELLE